jgi:hypothetical protein
VVCVARVKQVAACKRPILNTPTAGAARMHLARPCVVCQQRPAAAEPHIARLHQFWECAVAQAVVVGVKRQLPPAWCSQPLTAQHILCMHPPAGGPTTTLHAGVWHVVCPAACVCAPWAWAGARRVAR